MVMVLRSGGLPGDKLPPVCHHWPGPLRALHQTLQMGAPLYHSPVGDITSSRRTELMMKANISILTHIYQINFFLQTLCGLIGILTVCRREEG